MIGWTKYYGRPPTADSYFPAIDLSREIPSGLRADESKLLAAQELVGLTGVDHGAVFEMRNIDGSQADLDFSTEDHKFYHGDNRRLWFPKVDEDDPRRDGPWNLVHREELRGLEGPDDDSDNDPEHFDAAIADKVQEEVSKWYDDSTAAYRADKDPPPHPYSGPHSGPHADPLINIRLDRISYVEAGESRFLRLHFHVLWRNEKKTLVLSEDGIKKSDVLGLLEKGDCDEARKYFKERSTAVLCVVIPTDEKLTTIPLFWGGL
jgi:hypothetical protein